MGRILLRLLSLLLLLALAGGGAAAWTYAQFTRPGPLTVARATIIPPGAGLEKIAATLAREGIVEYPEIFMLGARVTGMGRNLKAGEFRFPAGVSPREAMVILRDGKTVVRRLTVAEGQTSAQILAKLAATDGLSGSVAGTVAEGTLLPETYHFSHGDNRAELIQRMRADMAAVLERLWPRRAIDLPYSTPEEAVVLASIIEKETGVAGERSLVAGVFVNRLRRGMRLQSDPTVAYGIAQGPLERPLTRADLKHPSPYNTYMNKGLPPGPIANPGIAALRAALNPAKTDFLYFVADGTGGHAFAKTLKAHNRNVAKWRRLRKDG